MSRSDRTPERGPVRGRTGSPTFQGRGRGLVTLTFVRKSIIATLGVALLLTAGAGSAVAGATRASRSVAGVHATLSQFTGYVLADNTTAACAMLTANGEKAWAKQNGASSCAAATKTDYRLLKAYPSNQKPIKHYNSTVKVTIHGNTATMPKLLGSGTRTLLYRQGLWYINS